MFLTVNELDHSLAFMQYEDIQRGTLMAKGKSGEGVNNGGKLKE